MGTCCSCGTLRASFRLTLMVAQSDSVYMAPPLLAYYGVIFQNATILFEAYNQIKLYRSYLLDTASNNLWRHVLLGGGVEDEGRWSTGAF